MDVNDVYQDMEKKERIKLCGLTYKCFSQETLYFCISLLVHFNSRCINFHSRNLKYGNNF